MTKKFDRSKVLDFGFNGRDLWTKAESFLINPVERRVYCDRLNIDGPFIECGVNALSHYSMLNPDKERIIMMTLKQYKDLSNSGCRILNLQEAWQTAALLSNWKTTSRIAV